MSRSEQNAAERCPQCGAIITEALPQRLCPACMMQRAITPSASEAAEETGDLPLTQAIDAGPPPSESGSPSPDGGDFLAAGGELVDGQKFGDYTIVRRLGRGGMGTVYEADHGPTGRRVALKVLTHSLDNPQARARFLREGRLAASINHPNSVYVYGTEEIGDTPSISMELIRGGTLQQWVKAQGEMDVAPAVDAVLQIIDGLEAADRKGVLHRDIKPANCFIDQQGTIKVGDFGLSISTEARDDQTITNVTREGIFLGTPAFASPEQLRGEPLDRRSDIYSVGVTLFYLLTGQTPFSGDNMVQLLATVLDKQPPSVRSIRPDVPEEIDVIIQRCLQKSAGQRFASYDAIREALLPLSSRSPTPATMGNRVIASVIDFVVLNFCFTFAMLIGQWSLNGQITLMPRFGADHAWYNVGFTLASLALPLLYYAVSEWRFGRTIGKHALGLRVVGGDQRITFRQALIRAAIFIVIPNLPSVLYSVKVREMTFDMLQQSPTNWYGMAAGLGFYLLTFGLFVTARARNGYAGVHELASGTRVVCRPKMKSRPIESTDPESFDTNANGLRIGPYHVLQPLWGRETDRLILAYDARLLRRVWLQTQPPGSPEVNATARNLARTTRLRWLGARRTDTECWDCYEALSGKPLTRAIDDGLPWETIVGALRQLSHELQLACNEGSLPDDTSLAHLWITEDESLKILPFDPYSEMHSAPSASPASAGQLSEIASETEETDRVKALQLLHEAAGYAFDATGLANGGQANRGTSLGAHKSLGSVCHASTFDQAIEQLDLLAAQPTVNIRRRAAGMLAISLAVPLLMLVSSFAASFVLKQQKSQMPEIEELSKMTIWLEIESRTIPEKPERIAALETLIAGKYRDLFEDRTRMSTLYAAMMLPPSRRERLKSLLARQSPSDEETAAAEQTFDKMTVDYKTTVPAEMSFLSLRGLVFISAVTWMELIWIPSLVTAVVFGGGALLWIFGLTLVNRRGQRASRLRVLVRMLLSGVPALGIACVFFSDLQLSAVWGGTFQLAIIAVVICLAAVALIGQRRLPHDLLAGTFLAAR